MERKGNSVKKIIALVLLLLMLPAAASAEKTDRRGLVEFIELYASRFAVYAYENGLEFDTAPLSSLPPWKRGDLLMFETSAGTAGVYPGGYDLHDLVITFYSLSDDDADNELYATSCVIAISALEFDAQYEVGPSLARKSAVEDAAAIFEEMGNGLEEALTQSMDGGCRVLIYSGNYDYFVEYVTMGNRDFVYLTAEERQ